MNNNISATIITFNPDIDRLIANVKSIIVQVNKLIIVDNYSEKFEEIVLRINNEDIETDKIEIIKNDINRGIAYALNQAFEWARNKGYKWVLTLDQDSIVQPKLIHIYSKYLEQTKEKIGMIVPAGYKKNKVGLGTELIAKEINFCITSGNLTNIDAWEKSGRFNEGLFIDAVDWDLCIKFLNNGYKMIKIENTYIEHQLGETINVNILGKKFDGVRHSSIRYYYFNRNIVLLSKKYIASNKQEVLWMLKRLINKDLLILLIEKERLHKTKMSIKGLVEGIKTKI